MSYCYINNIQNRILYKKRRQIHFFMIYMTGLQFIEQVFSINNFPGIYFRVEKS